MKKTIEDFIRERREAFDHREPSDRVWTKIERATSPTRSLWSSLVVWRAAAVIFMALSAYLLVPKSDFAPQSRAAMNEFRDAEAFYIRQISEKVELIDAFQSREGLNGFTRDFQQLEAMYLVLKEEMRNRPSQQVKDALVLNLLVRIDLLNQHLDRLESEFPKQTEEDKPAGDDKKKSNA